MLAHPQNKYRPFEFLDFSDRTWPSQKITTAPVWCSTDLRDGNQALANPMDHHRKLKFFQLLVQCGLKEIELLSPLHQKRTLTLYVTSSKITKSQMMSVSRS